MSKHLFGAIITAHGIAANNRGETEGNTTTLQKVLWNGDLHSTVSAEAIRWAIRADFQRRGLAVNRTYDEITRRHTFQDGDFVQGGASFVDDDILGYMSAQAAREEAGAEEADEQAAAAPAGRGRRSRQRGTALVRRSRFEATRAVSLTPWTGDVVFSVAGPGATPSASRTSNDPVPYAAEVHATRYQYGFAMTPEGLLDQSRSLALVDAVVDLAEVAGNHSRYYYDFSPDSVIFRWTDDAAPRLLYCYQVDDQGRISVPELLRRVQSGDISASELIVGGSLADTGSGAALREAGATVYAGVKAAAADVKRRLAGLTE